MATPSCALLLILKYTPGFHLRVTDEAEMMGLDYDQFFDEAIGEWSLQEAMEMGAAEHANQPTLTHGIVKDGANSSAEKISEDTGVKA
jgi:Amt family ammonium transporter